MHVHRASSSTATWSASDRLERGKRENALLVGARISRVRAASGSCSSPPPNCWWV